MPSLELFLVGIVFEMNKRTHEECTRMKWNAYLSRLELSSLKSNGN